jgi:pyridoxamine 5'-phosphate oxidase-like protein
MPDAPHWWLMVCWAEVERAAPELAAAVRTRFEAHGLGLLATLRRDGSPRISGIEPLFALGELWLGMMPDSRKALDLLRDRRFALHSATTDKQVTNGDARIAGVGLQVADEATFSRFRSAFAEHAGYPPPPGPFQLFRADVKEMSMIKPGGDHLDIDFWRESQTPTRIERR